MKRLTLLTLIVLVLSTSFIAQKSSDKWLRTITQDTLTVDVDPTSLVIGSGGVISATYRTSFQEPEALPQDPSVKYRMRLDVFDFRTRDASYRLAKTSYFDDSGKVILESNPNQDWKLLSRGTGRILYSAASQLAPFGVWNVESYHYASGEPADPNDPKELRSLVGKTVGLRVDDLSIGLSNCPGVIFDSRIISDHDVVQRLGVSLTDLGVSAKSIPVMTFNCASKSPVPAMVFLTSSTKAKLLWDGVFFDIERPANPFRP
jgi:hypothetical protein